MLIHCPEAHSPPHPDFEQMAGRAFVGAGLTPLRPTPCHQYCSHPEIPLQGIINKDRSHGNFLPIRLAIFRLKGDGLNRHSLPAGVLRWLAHQMSQFFSRNRQRFPAERTRKSHHKFSTLTRQDILHLMEHHCILGTGRLPAEMRGTHITMSVRQTRNR